MNYADRAGAWNPNFGFGVPNARASVLAALGAVNSVQLLNRLTPLFAFNTYDSNPYGFGTGFNTFFTTVPQMGTAALENPLVPQPELYATPYNKHSATTVLGYATYPGWNAEPPERTDVTADVYLFTTHNNPLDSANELTPVYRMSYLTYTENGFGDLTTLILDHTYATSDAEIQASLREGYLLDGLEGYIYPKTQAQPEGTVKLMRKWYPAKNDHVIFPETLMGGYDNYTENVYGSDWIGWVYPNVDLDGDELIDGWELLLGTKPGILDSDCDGMHDGLEYPLAGIPQEDPLYSDSALILPAQTVTGVKVVNHCFGITAGPSVVVSSTGNLTLQAWHHVVLKPGFSVAPGGVVRIN